MANVRIVKNIGLGDSATSTQTSTVDEPTAAASGQNIFVTGNWFASRSTNGGTSWSLVDPFTTLPSAAGGFCCDQIVLYEPTRDIWIWILQYIRKDNSNIFRVAVSRGNASVPGTGGTLVRGHSMRVGPICGSTTPTPR